MWDSRIAKNLPGVRDRIETARNRAGRTDRVRLVAVSKGHPPEAAAAAVRAGLDALGENRVQELAGKVEAVGRDLAEWHMIGHLQRNKVRGAVGLFDLIQSVDSLRLARTLSKEAVRADVVIRGLMQVNVSGEAAKGGFGPEEAVEALGTMADLPGLEIHGLMTMAPHTDVEEVLRRTFQGTRTLLEELVRQVPTGLEGRELSMGMSNDFEIAVEEGATMVRLGTVLFGERQYD